MGFMSGVFENAQPCVIEFRTRLPKTELKRMMHNDSDIA
jgi:hypothetical protein